MAIIKHINAPLDVEYFNLFPDQFKTEKEKQNHDWIKSTMDYFANKAFSSYVKKRETIGKNYDLLNGILRKEDFYEEPEVKSFVETLESSTPLPDYVKHYSILTSPMNQLIGELTRRPDGFRVKAFDDESKSEELQYKTKILNDYVLSKAKLELMEELSASGVEISQEEFEELTFEKVKEELSDYTSVGESWGNHILRALKVEFNIKEKEEEFAKDLFTAAEAYWHIYEDNSKLGFNIEILNPINTWELTTPDKKFTSDPSGRLQGAYAAGTLQLMEISEIIERFPFLTNEEIEHLREEVKNYGLYNARESNISNPRAVGIDSIKYDTYDPLVIQYRMMLESSLSSSPNEVGDLFSFSPSVSSLGYKFTVVTAYWVSKRKIGKVTYIDELGIPQSVIVDENYKKGTLENEISIEWGWINQWYYGVRIGSDVYHVKPYKLLNYCPIIGTKLNAKNSKPTSFVSIAKPFQVLYNICMNQLYELLNKEIGNIASVSIRRVPRAKDEAHQDAIDTWEMEARKRGIMFDDDSPENTKSPVSNQTVARNIDLTRSSEIQSRYNLAVALKRECWEIIGMSRERLGSIAATQTATGTNVALSQSYSQTEPMFVAHEYVKFQLYQAILDAALYVEASKPVSTISYITSEGDSAFVEVNGIDLKLRDLKIFPTNRPEDRKIFDDIQALAPHYLNTTNDYYGMLEILTSDSIRKLKRVFKDEMEYRRQLETQQIENQRDAAERAERIEREKLQIGIQEKEKDRLHDAYQREKDRINKKEVAVISALRFGKVEAEDENNNQVFDIMELERLKNDRDRNEREYQLKLSEMLKDRELQEKKLKLEEEKLKVQRENMKNDLQIAKENAKNRKRRK